MGEGYHQMGERGEDAGCKRSRCAGEMGGPRRPLEHGDAYWSWAGGQATFHVSIARFRRPRSVKCAFKGCKRLIGLSTATSPSRCWINSSNISLQKSKGKPSEWMD